MGAGDHIAHVWQHHAEIPADTQPAGSLLAEAMTDYRHVLTDRLDLTEPDAEDDLEELFAIFSDPGGWRDDPAGGHTDRERTRDGWLAQLPDSRPTD